MTSIIEFSEFSEENFLAQYWQKKPLLIKNAFPSFEDPIEGNELAGLALEEFIESRIIATDKNENWQVMHGPFEDFPDLGESNWTLLVQAVNNWNRDVDSLISFVNFIPRWRIDDVMVSFSTPGGGVGPHLDQYDVFIIQGEGKRRWRVGDRNPALKEVFPHEDLKQVEDFSPIIDEITESGDILYIPPGYPHDGVAIDNSLNYSIGFQAPHAQELVSGFADKLIDKKAMETRFGDAERKISNSEVMSAKDYKSMKEFMLSAFTDEALVSNFIGSYLTKSHHELEIWVPENELSEEVIEDICLGGQDLVKVSGIKSLILEDFPDSLFINGEEFSVDDENRALAHDLLEQKLLTSEALKSFISSLKNIQLLTSVINRGYWYFE